MAVVLNPLRPNLDPAEERLLTLQESLEQDTDKQMAYLQIKKNGAPISEESLKPFKDSIAALTLHTSGGCCSWLKSFLFPSFNRIAGQLEPLSKAAAQLDGHCQYASWERTKHRVFLQLAAGKIDRLSQNLQTMTTDRDAKQQNVLLERRRKEAAEQARNAAQQQYAALQARVNGAEQERNAAQQQYAVLQARVNGAEQERNTAQQRCAASEAQVKGLEANLQQANIQIAKHQLNEKSLQDNILTQIKKIKQLNEELLKLRETEKVANQQIEELPRTKQDLRRIRLERNNLKQTSAAAQTEIQVLKQQLDATNTKQTEVEKDRDLLKQKVDEYVIKNSTQLQALHEQVAKMQQTAEKLKMLQQQNQKLTETQDHLRQRIQEQDTRMSTLIRDKEELSRQMARLQLPV